MSRHSLTEGLAALAPADKRLLKATFAAALAALVLGVLWGAATALAATAAPDAARMFLRLTRVSALFMGSLDVSLLGEGEATFA